MNNGLVLRVLFDFVGADDKSVRDGCNGSFGLNSLFRRDSNKVFMEDCWESKARVNKNVMLFEPCEIRYVFGVERGFLGERLGY